MPLGAPEPLQSPDMTTQGEDDFSVSPQDDQDTDWAAEQPEQGALEFSPLPKVDVDDLQKGVDDQDGAGGDNASSFSEIEQIPEEVLKAPVESPSEQPPPEPTPAETPFSEEPARKGTEELPDFEIAQEQPSSDEHPLMFSEPAAGQPASEKPAQETEKRLPSYTYETMPKVDDFVARRKGRPLEIFVSAADYAKMFYEIRNIDNLAKHSFKTVMKIKDISGNQNNLLSKYHADLDFINERLAYIDGVLFESDET